MTDIADVEINDVSFAYNGRYVLEDVNLTIKSGEFASIVGPNGGGKTTLLKLLLGLLKPSQGKIRVFGQNPVRSRIEIGYMPQYSTLDMKFPVSVMDVVLMGRLGHSFSGRYSRQDKEAALGALSEMKMDDLQRRHFSELSGGQKQRVLIARALCSSPRLLLLDEPTANVDSKTEEAFFDILQNLNQRMTILLVSHDIGFVSNAVRSVICVNRRVVIHPTSSINGEIIQDMYGGDLRLIRHDHRCSEGGHEHV